MTDDEFEAQLIAPRPRIQVPETFEMMHFGWWLQTPTPTPTRHSNRTVPH